MAPCTARSPPPDPAPNKCPSSYQGSACEIASADADQKTSSRPHQLVERAGGGVNHRFGLYDAILIKDNHIVAAGGVGPALESSRSRSGHMVKVEIEVTTIAELKEAMAYAPDAVLLDNMDLATLAEAVTVVARRVVTEASGGVTLETVRQIANTGVDFISVGALTHSAPVLDVGFDFTPVC